MKFYLCIDDTDDATKSIGTGQIASMIYDALQEKGSVMRYQVTRHQLLLDPRIEYTSHNSSMCMEGDTELEAEYLLRKRAETSNPGICLYIPPEVPDRELLCRFGREAKEQVFTVEDAVKAAEKMPGVRLGAPAGNGNGCRTAPMSCVPKLLSWRRIPALAGHRSKIVGSLPGITTVGNSGAIKKEHAKTAFTGS